MKNAYIANVRSWGNLDTYYFGVRVYEKGVYEYTEHNFKFDVSSGEVFNRDQMNERDVFALIKLVSCKDVRKRFARLQKAAAQ